MNRHGAVLIEVLVALVILTVASLSALQHVGQFIETQSGFHRAESELLAAEQRLIAVSLLTRTELDQRIGRRILGNHWVTLGRPEPELYRIGVAALESPEVEIITAVVHRRDDRRTTGRRSP